MHDQEDRSAVRNSSLQPKGIHDRLRLRESFFRGGFQEDVGNIQDRWSKASRDQERFELCLIFDARLRSIHQECPRRRNCRIEQYAVPDIGE
jgi:hypothetical protein